VPGQVPLRLPPRAVGALAALTIVLVGLGAARPDAAPRERVVTLGGLFSLTGNWSTRGQTSKAAMELAIADVNQYLAGNAADLRFAASIEDTRLEPDVALAQAKSLHAGGVQLLIGPQSSAEVARLKPFVDANAMLLVSPASTAGSLAIAGDNVFRFTPADSLEGVAISAMMWEDGIRAVVPVWRDDPGNAGLEKATRARFASLGGTVLDGVAYDANATDFGTTAASVAARVREVVARSGAQEVGVYLAGFDEVVGLFASASADSVLRSVRWYGSDGAANSAALLRDPRAAAFAVHVRYPTPLFAVEEGARDIWAPLAERIRARTGHVPDAYALTVYDAVWVVARGYVASGATRDIEKLKHAFTTAASTHYGATGWTALNAAGDRRYANFDFFAVRPAGATHAWTHVGGYDTRAGTLSR
jgi:branched-chain amino acid transport system substrate-binding protein